MLIATVIVMTIWVVWLAIRVAKLEEQLTTVRRRLTGAGVPPIPLAPPDPDARMKATGRWSWYGSIRDVSRDPPDNAPQLRWTWPGARDE